MKRTQEFGGLWTLNPAVCLLLLVLGSGCTSTQLEENSMGQGKSLSVLEYEMVLDNLAMFKQASNALPWHVNITKASITVNDTVSPSFSYKWPMPARTLGFGASRVWQGDWTFSTVTDTRVLERLRTEYQEAVKSSWLQWCTPANLHPGCISGHWGNEFVYVLPSDQAKLANQTMRMLQIAGFDYNPSIEITNGSDAMALAKKLSQPDGDLTLQYLSTQLGPGLKLVLVGFNSTRPPELLKKALENDLNRLIKSWTFNDAIQLGMIMKMTANPPPQNLLDRLGSNSVTGRALMELNAQLLINAFQKELQLQTPTNSTGPRNSGFFQNVGPTPTIGP